MPVWRHYLIQSLKRGQQSIRRFIMVFKFAHSTSTLWLEKITGEKAEKVYLDNLKYASDVASKNNMSVLIEPLNPFDMPGYFLRDTTHACDLISTLQLTNVKLMFDCYHVGRTEGDVISRFKECFPYIGHIQFASVPDRGPPDQGIVDYDAVFAAIDAGGWNTPLGAEYQVDGPTENTLHWLKNQTGSD